MKFTVREVGPNAVTVDFADGSWAEVPYSEGLDSKDDLVQLIDTYAPKDNTIPDGLIASGEELEYVKPEVEEVAEEPEPLLSYEQMRAELYPSKGDQLDALYWARKGDSSHLEEIDKAIEEVKAKVPKDIKLMTREAFSQFLLDE